MSSNIIPLYSARRTARPMQSSSGFTRAGGTPGLRRVPEALFEKPHLASTNPDDVAHECQKCGLIQPLEVLIGQTGRIGYLRRRCECEVRERENQQMSAFLCARSETAKKKNIESCYSWLGKGNEQKTLETKTFENFLPERQTNPSIVTAYQKMMLYASALTTHQQDVANVLLTGPNGIGKTHLACAAINLARDVDVPCFFATVPHLFDALYATDFDQRPAFLLKVVQVRVLVLDELDKLYVKRVEAEGDAGSYQSGVLGEIINGRYNKGLPTIITTNEDSDLGKWLDKSARSRLRENMLALPMDGVDMRGRLRGGK